MSREFGVSKRSQCRESHAKATSAALPLLATFCTDSRVVSRGNLRSVCQLAKPPETVVPARDPGHREGDRVVLVHAAGVVEKVHLCIAHGGGGADVAILPNLGRVFPEILAVVRVVYLKASGLAVSWDRARGTYIPAQVKARICEGRSQLGEICRVFIHVEGPATKVSKPAC